MKLNLTQPSDELLMSLAFGAIGGAVCGSLIFSFASLTGHSGTTGLDYVGAWDLGDIVLGAMYGGFFGILMGPLGYIIFLRNIGLKKAILPASIGTILGGCWGAFHGLLSAQYYGFIGFFLSLFSLWLIMHTKDRFTAIKQK